MKKIAQFAVVIIVILLANTSTTSAQNTLDEALQMAKTENKHVFVNFSGSDWCRSCIILKKTILNTAEFENYTKENLIILDVDFPRLKKNRLSKEQIKINEALAAKYNSKGQFPTILLLDSNAKILGKTGYKKLSPNKYIEHIQSFIK